MSTTPNRQLFVTGMFRSGTTLMAKIMDAHPEISFASDPYRPMFNDFRDLVAEENRWSQDISKQAPLGDYFSNLQELKLMKAIQAGDFDHEISAKRLEALIPIMARRTEEFSLHIAQKMAKVKGKTYRELYLSMMDLIQECYGKPNAKIVGSKEVWCNEFTGLLLKAFPDMKVIHVIRDPRAVSASRKMLVEGEHYPWTFLARQWRKLASFTHYFSTVSEFKKSVLVVRYEDLVANAPAEAQRICDFLEVDYTEQMLDGTKFRDGDGTSWKANSSYETSQSITAGYTQKWKKALSDEEIRWVELLCSPDMEAFGYEPLNPEVRGPISERDIQNPMIVPETQLADWIKPFVSWDKETNIQEMKKEATRRNLLFSAQKESPELIESLFQFQSTYENLRAVVKKSEIHT